MPETGRSFEDDLKELENIVNRLDSGELALEESIEAFERGVHLVKRLNKRLDEIERKVELLVREAHGELRTIPFSVPPSTQSSTPAGEDEEES